MSDANKPELLPSGKWSYRGMEFGSEEAANSFKKSRDDEPSFAARVWETKAGKWLVAGLIFFAALSAANLLPKSERKSVVAPEGDISRPISLSAEQLDAFAFLINANGQLCAKPLSVIRLGNDRFSVNCLKMRDPADGTTITHTVNMKSGRLE